MKTLMKTSVLVMLLGANSLAQTSSTTVSTPTTATTAMPAGTSTSSTAAQTPAERAVKLNIISQSAVGLADLENGGSRPAAYTYTSMGVKYKINAKHSMELRANAETKFQTENEAKTAKVDKTTMLDPSIHHTYKSDVKLMGSAPIVLGSRYLIPVSQAAYDNSSYGGLRFDTSIDWELNPKVTTSLILSPRMSFSNPAGKLGGESKLSLIAGPAVTYNFNDKFSAYYAGTVYVASDKHTRGQMAANIKNEFSHEVGLKITAGAFSINPALITTQQGLNRSGYEDVTNDQNTELGLIVAAVF